MSGLLKLICMTHVAEIGAGFPTCVSAA